jgi:hypothetical protein
LSLPPRCPVCRPSAGPVTVQSTFVFPISRYEDPSAAAWVLICAWMRRSSFQRRPSRRKRASEYVDVSSGILKIQMRWRDGGREKKIACASSVTRDGHSDGPCVGSCKDRRGCRPTSHVATRERASLMMLSLSFGVFTFTFTAAFVLASNLLRRCFLSQLC